ncbi:hypothetical protein IQ07DRAFT_649243 [Pyrenochaeta sp. DS3sAY3a]|nr:hypothetical protein IQ07DRAFT_649243 [Pyrenochaeta sp. DS3sAY3a]
MLSYARSNIQGGSPLRLNPTVDNQIWHVGGYEQAEFIEALSFSTIDGSNKPSAGNISNACRHGRLTETEILEWVTQSGGYIPLKNPTKDGVLQGGIRLLVLERLLYQPASFDIKKETYLAIEQRFHLPENTLYALSDVSGLSTYALDIDDDTGALKSLTMVIKASQKFQVGNYGLAFSHDFSTGLSTGILHGTGVTGQGLDYPQWEKYPAAEIFEYINTVHRLWTHPLILPVTLLQHHIARTDFFCTIHLANQHTDVQHQLGTMRAGRLDGLEVRNIALDLPVQEAKLNLRDLTVKMSSLMFECIWFCVVSDWQCSCLKSLNEIIREMKEMKMIPKRTNEIQVRIRNLTASAESIKRNNNSMRDNGQADMNVLYSIISQVDNRLNAKMAAASSRDSAAMKTLAFLATLFLPGTFIASIFSTGMFNWKVDPDKSAEGRVVSEYFWIYWVFAIPLTIAVGVGWWLWWNWEKKHFDRDFSTEIEVLGGEETKSGLLDALQAKLGAQKYSVGRPPDGKSSRASYFFSDLKSAARRRVGMKEVNPSGV